ncbi:MAG: glycerol-3-phosphate O-acyltransferase/dihydroxyacetone phosphate acyltransferase, partial [Paracoccaceae bacterium]
MDGPLCVHCFFSSDRNHRQRPETGPVIIVAKHANSLVDGGIISTYFPRMPRVLAASTVWDYKPLAPLLDAAGVIPMYRVQDQRADPVLNRRS